MSQQPIAIAALIILTGCAATQPNITGSQSQVALRQIQTREYRTLDKQMTMRSVVATLQDFGFVIDNAEADVGSITATRLGQYRMRMTVMVREREEQMVLVRANARYGERAIDDPETYQDFFMALDKALFLTTHQVD